MADKKHALYLVKDGKGGPKLFRADDVESALADGWKQPGFPRSNGTAWNRAEDLDQQDAAADGAKVEDKRVASVAKPSGKNK